MKFPAVTGLRAWIALMFLTLLIRLPALLHPAPIDDESIYAVVADVIVDGGLPYADAIERKPPLLFWTYAAVFRFAGRFNVLALHLVAVAWVLLTMAGLVAVARRLSAEPAGWIAALLYTVFQPWGTARNLALNGEVLMNLPLVWAYAIAFGHGRTRWRPALVMAGALLATAFLLKQPAAIAAVPIGVYLLLPSYRAARGVTRGDSIVQAALLTAGFVGVLAMTVLVLWRQGILADAYYWTITDHTVPHVFWKRAVEHTAAFTAIAWPLLLPLAAWPLLKAAWRQRRAEFAAMLGWVAVSALGTAAGGRFYPHYYIQLVPPLAVLAAVVYAYLLRTPEVPHPRLLAPRVAGLWTLLVALAFIPVYCVNLAPRRQPTAVSVYVRAHSSADDRLFVWGQTTGMYFEARRRPATRYIATFPLTGYIFGEPLPGVSTDNRILPGAWERFAADWAAHPPAFIIDTEVGVRARYPLARFPYLQQIIASDYRQVATLSEGVIYERRDVVSDVPPDPNETSLRSR